MKKDADRTMANLKQDQEDLHDREKKAIKARFKQKLALERERII